jgi:hypothetical protein
MGQMGVIWPFVDGGRGSYSSGSEVVNFDFSRYRVKFLHRTREKSQDWELRIGRRMAMTK